MSRVYTGTGYDDLLPGPAHYPVGYQLVVIGAGGVGKSALTSQFIENRFYNRYHPTIEGPGHRWTGTMEMRGGDGFLLVYSVTSRKSFEEISTFHQQILRVKERNSFPVILVGNMCDLKERRKVSSAEGRDLAQHLGCRFIETSAKKRANVDEAFTNLVREIRRYQRAPRTLATAKSGAPGVHGGGKNDGNHGDGCSGCVVV